MIMKLTTPEGLRKRVVANSITFWEEMQEETKIFTLIFTGSMRFAVLESLDEVERQYRAAVQPNTIMIDDEPIERLQKTEEPIRTPEPTEGESLKKTGEPEGHKHTPAWYSGD